MSFQDVNESLSRPLNFCTVTNMESMEELKSTTQGSWLEDSTRKRENVIM